MIINDKVNSLKLFVASDESKLSVTLSPDNKKYPCYHGLHPKFDEKMLIQFLISNDVNRSGDFWNEIKKIQEKDSLMNLIINYDLNEKVDIPFDLSEI